HGLWRVVSESGESPAATAAAGRPHTDVALVCFRGAGAAPRVIARAVYDTKPLASHNGAYVREKSAQMILREVARCLRDGTPADLGPLPAVATPPPPALPGYVGRSLRGGYLRLRHRIAGKQGYLPRAFGLKIGRGTAADFDPLAARPVPMPRISLWADPFLIRRGEETWCFFEDVDPARGFGHISAGRVTEQGLVDVQTVMRQPHHMSFPFVFWHEGELLMMPEVHAAGRLEIWRCTDFPGKWDLYSTAFEGTPCADSVLFRRGEEWWLFTHQSRDSFGDFCSDLHIYRVDGPALNRLVPHRLNPVVTDAATARGGGRIHVTDDGRVLRFSQDNSGGSYGWGLNAMEILRLDLDHYEERRVRHVRPDFAPGLIGCHHFDASDGWFVIDVRYA
ncbi:glucosamine inositolphosphorylceramide transferase family protein, partial [Oceaniglobus roseus]|uniref:glucosamine inositolphosphorylceramide transferase family protein n=1 Tax=Oceaniglobus roseus TaxID=1737570 RepID=UPI000C7ED912